jgi:M6 family metalloprotease-like protein
MKNTQTVARIALVSILSLSHATPTLATVQMGVGGKHLPVNGTVKVLVVFAQFKDDVDQPSNPEWPSGQLPRWANNLFATQQSASYPAWSVSDYYAQMSFGRYHVIGDVYPELITTPLTAVEYAQQGKLYGDVNRDVLTKAAANGNFRAYDRWSTTTMNGRLYTYEVSDGVVEMVFVLYRNIPSGTFGATTLRRALGYDWSAIAMLGFTSPVASADGVVIKGSFPGSGVTVINAMHMPYPKLVSILAHEYGHYLFEVHHFETRGGLGLMGGSGPAMNAYERARLGWITLIDVYADRMIELDDYVTTGQAARVIVSSDEFFLVENRQRLSIYDGLGRDGEDVKPYGAGMYIFHVKGAGVDNLDVESAAGNWDWSVEKWFSNPWDLSMQLPLIVRTTPNSKGRDTFDAHCVNNRSYFKDFARHPTQDTIVYTAASQGSQEDAFRLGGNTTFAPWTNPNSNRVDGVTTGYVIRLINQYGNKLHVWFSLRGDAGPLTSAADEQSDGSIPASFELLQNYPNPFNPATEISYRTSEASHITLKVFNLLGHEVAALVNEVKPAGTHRVRWDATENGAGRVSSGTYLCVLEAGGQRLTKRMSLVK